MLDADYLISVYLNNSRGSVTTGFYLFWIYFLYQYIISKSFKSDLHIYHITKSCPALQDSFASERTGPTTFVLRRHGQQNDSDEVPEISEVSSDGFRRNQATDFFTKEYPLVNIQKAIENGHL